MFDNPVVFIQGKPNDVRLIKIGGTMGSSVCDTLWINCNEYECYCLNNAVDVINVHQGRIKDGASRSRDPGPVQNWGLHIFVKTHFFLFK